MNQRSHWDFVWKSRLTTLGGKSAVRSIQGMLRQGYHQRPYDSTQRQDTAHLNGDSFKFKRIGRFATSVG